jgi:hypothetical protein
VPADSPPGSFHLAARFDAGPLGGALETEQEIYVSDEP